MQFLSDPHAWVGLLTLIVLEIVLGIDNVVFISILAGKLPQEQQGKARRMGLALALITRVLLLFSLSWVVRLTAPLFVILNEEISGRDLVLLLGGLFLLAKSTHEIYDQLEGQEGHASARVYPSFTSVLIQIVLLDIVFSLDSVITAVGMVNQIPVMVTAVVLAVVVMVIAADRISSFIHDHPSIKILALSFLLLIGVLLVAEGFDRHIPRGYVYFSMAYAVFVEGLNIRARAKRVSAAPPVELRSPYAEGDGKAS